MRYRAFGFALAALLVGLLWRAAPPAWLTGLLVTLLTLWGLLSWLGYFLAARGESVKDSEIPVSLFGLRVKVAKDIYNKLLGFSDQLMLFLLLSFLVVLAWFAVVSPALEAISGGGVSIDPLR